MAKFVNYVVPEAKTNKGLSKILFSKETSYSLVKLHYASGKMKEAKRTFNGKEVEKLTKTKNFSWLESIGSNPDYKGGHEFSFNGGWEKSED